LPNPFRSKKKVKPKPGDIIIKSIEDK